MSDLILNGLYMSTKWAFNLVVLIERLHRRVFRIWL